MIMVLREGVRVSEECVRRLGDPAQGSCLEAAASRWVEGARTHCREKERVRTWDALRQVWEGMGIAASEAHARVRRHRRTRNHGRSSRSLPPRSNSGVPGVLASPAAPSAADGPRPECMDAVLAGTMGMASAAQRLEARKAPSGRCREGAPHPGPFARGLRDVGPAEHPPGPHPHGRPVLPKLVGDADARRCVVDNARRRIQWARHDARREARRCDSLD